MQPDVELHLGTIVVIEDEDSVRNLVASVLEDGGFEVVAFEDAQPALETVDFNQVDALVTDLMMPTRGENAIHTIRSKGYSLPIVVLSGVINPGEEETLIAIGATRVLKKPFNMQQVLNTVLEVLPNDVG